MKKTAAVDLVPTEDSPRWIAKKREMHGIVSESRGILQEAFVFTNRFDT